MKKDKYTFTDILIMGVSLGVTTLGLLILLGAIVSITEGKEKNIVTSLLLMLIFGIGPIIGGFYIYKNVKMRKLRELKSDIEQMILKIAHQNNGIVTPSELALNSGMSLEESKDELDKLQLKGYSDIEVNEEGRIYYKFDAF